MMPSIVPQDVWTFPFKLIHSAQYINYDYEISSITIMNNEKLDQVMTVEFVIFFFFFLYSRMYMIGNCLYLH